MPKCEANCAVNKLITDAFLRNFCLFEVQLKYLRSQLYSSAIGVETLMVSAAILGYGRIPIPALCPTVLLIYFLPISLTQESEENLGPCCLWC